MESMQQYSLKKLNNATSKHFPIVLLLNSLFAFSVGREKRCTCSELCKTEEREIQKNGRFCHRRKRKDVSKRKEDEQNFSEQMKKCEIPGIKVKFIF